MLKVIEYSQLEIFSIFTLGSNNNMQYVKFNNCYAILDRNNIPHMHVSPMNDPLPASYIRNALVYDTQKRWSIVSKANYETN